MLLISNQLIGEEKNFKRNFWQCDEWVFLVMNSRKLNFLLRLGSILYTSQFVCAGNTDSARRKCHRYK